MRRGLMWALGATALLSAAALWTSEVPRVVAVVEPRLRDAVASLGTLDRPAGGNGPAPSGPLPSEMPGVVLDTAKRDVFVPYAPPPASAAPAPPPPAPPPPSPPPSPQAPALNLRFLGSMVTPNGERLVYLARGDVEVPVIVGTRLDEGYVVTSITADAVGLIYPPLNVRVVLPIPQPAQR